MANMAATNWIPYRSPHRPPPPHIVIVPIFSNHHQPANMMNVHQAPPPPSHQLMTSSSSSNGWYQCHKPNTHQIFVGATNTTSSTGTSNTAILGQFESASVSMPSVSLSLTLKDENHGTMASPTIVIYHSTNEPSSPVSATKTSHRMATLNVVHHHHRNNPGNKSPRKHQKHSTTSNGSRSNSISSNASKCDVWSLTSSKQNDRAEYSSNEDLATCSKDMPRVNIDDEDPGTIDDVNTSGSEYSPKIRRKQKKKSAARHRRCKKNSIDVDDNKENLQSIRNQKLETTTPAAAVEATVVKHTYTDRVMSELTRCRALTPPLRQHIKLNLPEYDLIQYLKHYLLSSNDLKSQGYPYRFGDKAGFFKKRFSGGVECFVPPAASFDVNAREFVPSNKRRSYAIERKSSSDSGQATASSASSSQSADSDSSDNNMSELKGNERTEKKCVRCTREFHVNESGEYRRSEKCMYHWGKMEYITTGGAYTCCSSTRYSKGCTASDEHVWNGYQMGFNGPLSGFVETKPTERSTMVTDGVEHDGVFALDCEMCYTGLGLEVTKVTLVGSDGRLIYEKFVRPTARIIDYNTRFSGITKKDLAAKNGSVLTLPEVQHDLLTLISADTILIGHALENDLRVLKLIHNAIIDTSVCFPHFNGPGYKHSLRSLTLQYLKRSIQDSDQGHSSFEDSRACLELMLWRVRKDFRAVLEQ